MSAGGIELRNGYRAAGAGRGIRIAARLEEELAEFPRICEICRFPLALRIAKIPALWQKLHWLQELAAGSAVTSRSVWRAKGMLVA